MRLLFRLIKLKLLSPASIYLFYRAKKVHGHNICSLLHYASNKYGNDIALTDGTTKISFSEMYRQVLVLSIIINKKLGALPSTAILVCSNNIRDVLVHYAIQNLGIKIILVYHKTHISEIKKIRDRLPDGTHIFSSCSDLAAFANSISIEDLFNDISVHQTEKIISKKYTALNFLTSGTTGEPKIIEKRKGVFYYMSAFAELVFRTGVYKRKAVFISTPFSHSFGYSVLIFSLILGKKTVMTNRKEPDQITRLLITEKVDMLTGVPTSLYQLSESCKDLNHCINLVISSGAPMNNMILQHIADRFGKNIFSLYGSTESSTSFVAGYNQLTKNCCALGKPLKGIKYRLGDEVGEGKELLINTPTANIFFSSWTPTGDIVKTDTQDHLVWCGRKNNMILKNGENIHPPEIENALLEIPFIEDAFVSGEKHPSKGEIIIAYIKLKHRRIVNETELRSHLSSLLSPIKIPDKFVESIGFEYTGTGKKIKPLIQVSPL